jgi:hypothetical protein
VPPSIRRRFLESAERRRRCPVVDGNETGRGTKRGRSFLLTPFSRAKRSVSPNPRRKRPWAGPRGIPSSESALIPIQALRRTAFAGRMDDSVIVNEQPAFAREECSFVVENDVDHRGVEAGLESNDRRAAAPDPDGIARLQLAGLNLALASLPDGLEKREYDRATPSRRSLKTASLGRFSLQESHSWYPAHAVAGLASRRDLPRAIPLD